MADIKIYDTTLRDGCQGTGISLSLRDKLDITRRLDDMGVDYIEGGWPGSNPKDAQFFAAMQVSPPRHARISAFGSTRKPGITAAEDTNIARLLEAGTPAVALVAKSWDFQVHKVLRTSLEENLAMVSDSVAYLKAAGREVILDAEHYFDGSRANHDYAMAVLQEAVAAGVDWLVLCDTNGGSLPKRIAAGVAEVVEAFGVGVGVHAHNDGELAVANALAGVEAGARQVQGTINGYGERIGNANLCSIIPDLVLKMGHTCTAGRQLSGMTALSHYVDEVANVAPNPRAPFVGFAAFAHKGGIHVHAVAADPTTYEHVDPALVGNERRILVSELSGRSNVVQRARELGIELDADVAGEVARKLKELEDEGFQFEDAAASFELLLHRCQPGYVLPFAPLAYLVASHKGKDDAGSESTAAAEVLVGGEVLRGNAVGYGPVDGLEKALRAALVPAYPQLANVSLVDFRSQIAGGRSTTRAPVRVRISATAPGAVPWTTVGSASDLLHASWLALADSLEYAVLTGVGAATLEAPRRPKVPAPPLEEVATLIRGGQLDDDDRATLRTLARTAWATSTLDLGEQVDRAFAADATALGACLFYSFGNFCAVAAHPRWESVRRVNLLKGRPENQVGSVTTTREHFDSLFDWARLPDGLSQPQVHALMDDFFELGPMGFRGAATASIPDYLTSLDVDIRTTQVISPGYRCPSNDLIGRILGLVGEDYLFITSANVSSTVSGRVEPAHYDLAGIQRDFGDHEGIVLIGHRDEPAVRASYPVHLPMSTSILAFHRVGREESGRPALVLERHGSLHVDVVREIADRHGFGLVLAEGARHRLPMREDQPALIGPA